VVSSWKDDAGAIPTYQRCRLVVRSGTKDRVKRLTAGGRYGATEDAVVNKLLDLADALNTVLPNALDSISGAPSK